jgi:transcriptional regulator with XRE-family HTH domain
VKPTDIMTIGIVSMLMDKTTNFGEWLKSERERRRWSQAYLANKCNITQSHIGRIENGTRQAGIEACIGIAHAFKLSEVTILQKAGWLTNNTNEGGDISFEDWKLILKELTEEQREELLRIAEVMRDMKQKRKAQKPQTKKSTELSY